jgi:hypothetical protein
MSRDEVKSTGYLISISLMKASGEEEPKERKEPGSLPQLRA